ncbi:hypothetical protein HPB48_003474 [Haemaphysalis longicornis]|uniref:Uncharacterized protein n=1 Tax=Haemaphysalis longicornis TaxID=44386 RepID=A0A9J6GDP2_HAELO|nr:hypothetical protein HPB48_003474 [Haemaphysalis longicornis]
MAAVVANRHAETAGGGDGTEPKATKDSGSSYAQAATRVSSQELPAVSNGLSDQGGTGSSRGLGLSSNMVRPGSCGGANLPADAPKANPWLKRSDASGAATVGTVEPTGLFRYGPPVSQFGRGSGCSNGRTEMEEAPVAALDVNWPSPGAAQGSSQPKAAPVAATERPSSSLVQGEEDWPSLGPAQAPCDTDGSVHALYMPELLGYYQTKKQISLGSFQNHKRISTTLHEEDSDSAKENRGGAASSTPDSSARNTPRSGARRGARQRWVPLDIEAPPKPKPTHRSTRAPGAAAAAACALGTTGGPFV